MMSSNEASHSEIQQLYGLWIIQAHLLFHKNLRTQGQEHFTDLIVSLG